MLRRLETKKACTRVFAGGLPPRFASTLILRDAIMTELVVDTADQIEL
jgi:hypothetical protein